MTANINYSIPGKKVCKLVMVTEDNKNKFYDMFEQSDGTFKIVRGRVDVTSVEERPCSMSKWESTIRSKIKKGYKML